MVIIISGVLDMTIVQTSIIYVNIIIIIITFIMMIVDTTLIIPDVVSLFVF